MVGISNLLCVMRVRHGTLEPQVRKRIRALEDKYKDMPKVSRCALATWQ